MPSIVTHHYFAKDVLKSSNPSSINLDIYYIFAQSFDNLFYYSFLTPFKGTNIRELGNFAQKNYSNAFFINILNFIKKNNYQNNEDILAFLFGSICHYALDTLAHPYIIYCCGDPKINPKYRGNHEKMEVMIDAIIYQKKENSPLLKAKLSDTLLPLTKFSQELISCLNYVYKKTYNVDNMGKIYQKSYQTGHYLLKFFVTDRTGLKKKLYQIKDHFGTGLMYQNLSFHVSNLDYSVLNLNHQTWSYQNGKKKSSSFIDIYNDAINFANLLIKTSIKYLNNQTTLKHLSLVFQDLSYITGLDWHCKYSTYYFKN